jgi:hypothetical protein
MTWTKPDPFATGLGVASSVLAGQQAGKQAAAEAARQAEQDRLAAVSGALANTKTIAETDETRARTTGLANTATHQHAEDVSHGYILPPGALPPEAPVQKPGGPPVSNRQWSDYYSSYAAFYSKNKAIDAASTAVGLAEKYGNLAKGEEAAQLALRKEANAEIETQARIHHWTALEKQAAKDAADKLVIASNHDATSVQNTQAHIAAMIRTANIAADSRLKAASIGASGALLRERETQKGEDRRGTLNRAGRGDTPEAKATNEAYQARLAVWKYENELGQVTAAASGRPYTPTPMPKPGDEAKQKPVKLPPPPPANAPNYLLQAWKFLTTAPGGGPAPPASEDDEAQ